MAGALEIGGTHKHATPELVRAFSETNDHGVASDAASALTREPGLALTGNLFG